jgi:hypothetical protein
MKKLKHVQLFESFTNEGMDSTNPPLPPVDISNSSDVIAVYHGSEGPIIGLLSPSEAKQFKAFYDMDKSSRDHYFADGDLNFYTKPGVAYVGMTLDRGYMSGSKPILAGPDYEPATELYFALGGYGTDYGSEPAPGEPTYGKYNYFGSLPEILDDPSHPAYVAHLKYDPEAAESTLDGAMGDFYGRMSNCSIVTLKRGYLTIFGGPSTKGYGTDAKTLPFREALEEIKRSHGMD